MDLMQLRRNLLMMPNGIPHSVFTFSLDGQIHNSNVYVPTDNFTILIDMPSFSAKPANNEFLLASEGKKYLLLGFYSNYKYFDVGSKRTTTYISGGYDWSQPGRFVAYRGNGGNVNVKQTNTSKSTAFSDYTFDGLDSMGYLIGNNSKRTTGETFSVYVYTQVLTNDQITNYLENGIIP